MCYYEPLAINCLNIPLSFRLPILHLTSYIRVNILRVEIEKESNSEKLKKKQQIKPFCTHPSSYQVLQVCGGGGGE